ncbi:thioredoxin reductase-like selenoprotein T homolog CG3887 [Ceratina calcarata]|uniref:Thioredoxin reductase-like selenoprotein T homolog CG3887 n=1 Tax=Ceratina calcarata TaxID=156304 RepID=A0AAJ7ND46_9HYME|nr:thioredoxin reductase-like selenoprotein T homolog CG3887 [Ceratina calcarata]
MLRRMKLILCVCMILCTLDSKAEDNQVSLTKLGSKTGPTLKFFYCYSCGYRKVFEEYVSILREKYPDLQINGENYNPSHNKMLIAKLLSFVKILLIILIVSGLDLGQQRGSLWQWCIDNRFYSCIMIFFIFNAIEGHFISSGAFEIHFNDVPVWSKLETGRIPQPLELFQIIDTHLNMQYADVDIG